MTAADQLDLEARVLALRDGGDLEGAVAAALEGSREAVTGFLRSTLDPDDAADAYAIFEEGVWKGIAGFRRECALRTWLFRIAAHATDRVRRDPFRRRARPLPSSSAREMPMASVSRIFPSGRHEGLQVLLDELDDEERGLLVLRVQHELEWEEIALVLREEAGREGPTADTPPNAAALRKRHERLVKRLHERARELGLLDP